MDDSAHPDGQAGNVAYLDPPYSHYFHRLATRIAARTRGQALALLSSPAYAIYTAGDRHCVWPPGTLADAPALPGGAEHALWSQPVEDERFRAAFWHAVAWLRERFVEHRTGICLIFSDARPFSLAAALAARGCGVRCLYFERGAFRMRTASLSTQGLNARFSLARARAHAGIQGLTAGTLGSLRPPEPWLKLRFLRFIAANELACRAAPERRWLQHKRYAPGPYLRLELAQRWAARGISHRADLQPDSRTPLMLVPMQLPADSQFRLYAPFASNQEFLDFVVGTARRAAPQVRVLVKCHPMDSARYRLPRGAQWVGGNLARWLALHPLVVCINSTVGFEAATRGVPVICFGPSFYTESDAVTLVTRDNFAELLVARMAAAPDAARGAALLADVLRCYQAPGDTWGYTDEDLEATAEIALQHLRADQS